mmetsp:Transcript_41185/g.80783  ORF Transcript_41185/g.80783 Transcript_41185/m.80783 type:complete len:208 (-) Transcript_41185:581-1204(-)
MNSRKSSSNFATASMEFDAVINSVINIPDWVPAPNSSRTLLSCAKQQVIGSWQTTVANQPKTTTLVSFSDAPRTPCPVSKRSRPLHLHLNWMRKLLHLRATSNLPSTGSCTIEWSSLNSKISCWVLSVRSSQVSVTTKACLKKQAPNCLRTCRKKPWRTRMNCLMKCQRQPCVFGQVVKQPTISIQSSAAFLTASFETTTKGRCRTW